MKIKILLICILICSLGFENTVFAKGFNDINIDSSLSKTINENITEDEWEGMIAKGEIKVIASDSQYVDIYVNKTGERAVNQIRINVTVGYENMTNSMLVYTTLYSPNPFDNSQFTGASGGVTVTGRNLFASDPIFVSQSPKSTLSFSNRIQDSRFQSGQNYTVQVGGRATGNNIIGGSGGFSMTTSARIP